jgi:hypothetical protein
MGARRQSGVRAEEKSQGTAAPEMQFRNTAQLNMSRNAGNIFRKAFLRMKTWVRKTLSVGVLAAGALLFAPGAANADVRQSTGDNNGILNGTQIAVPVSVPVNIVGNSLGILGAAHGSGIGVNHRTEHGRSDRQSTGHNNGILNGTQVYLPVNVPVNVVGNSAALLGQATATGVGVNNARGRKAESTRNEGGWWPGGGQSTGNNNGILNGTQIYAPIDVPINVCGNSLALVGGAYSQAICANNVWSARGGKGWKKESKRTEGAWQSTGDNNGIANGTQLLAPISLPVNLAGNSLAILGSANSRAVAVNENGHDDGFGQSTGNNNGILNGTQIGVPINVPINVCGNSLGILGAAHSAAGCVNGHSGLWGNDGDDDCKKPCWGGDNGGHHPGGNGGNGGNNGDDDDYLGDNDDQDDTDTDPDADADGYGGNANANDGYTKPAAANDGYTKPADDNAGADDYTTNDDDKRRKSDESSPVTGLTETVGGVSDSSGLAGLGLLNTLR